MAGKKILLVEGKGDQHVFMNLCGARSIGKLDVIEPQDSVGQLLDNFPEWLKVSDIEVLGVVIDADTDFAGQWAALKGRLNQAGYHNVPDQPVSEGTILPPPPATLLPRFGCWVMPDNQTAGKLEDFLRFLVPSEGRLLLDRAEASVTGIPSEQRRFSQPDEIKAVMHTWLAWQKEPGRPFGTAIAARFLDPNVPQADALVAWLRRLFFT